MNILFVSLGCDKNLVDSEVMLGMLKERGYTFTDDQTQADAAVVNTCCFINDAKEESIQTILELAELKKTYEANAVPIDLGEDGFVVTRKVQSLLLIDEQNKKFCISGNPTVSKEYSRPEIYHYEDLMGYMLICEPELTPEELVHLKEDKKTVKVIKKLKVRMKIKGVGIKDLVVLASPVRSSTYAFRKSYQVAMDILKELNAIKEA